MITLAAADTIAGVAESATTVNCAIFGLEVTTAGVETYKCLYQGQLAAAAATLYTVPASTTAFVRSVHVVNTSASATKTFQLFRGGTAAANAITDSKTLPAGGMAVYSGDGWDVQPRSGDSISPTVLVLPGAASPAQTAEGSVVWDSDGDWLTVGAGAATKRIFAAGTAFPSSPATGERFFRTDLGVGYYWDGTRWLSTTLYREPLGSFYGNTASPANTNNQYLAPWYTTDIWMVGLYGTFYVATTNDGGSYWTVVLAKATAANTATTIASFPTNTTAPDTWGNYTAAIGALLTPGTYPVMHVGLTKTGTPGGIWGGASMSYRLVG